MKRSTKYVGLDVHQATSVVSVRDDTGRVISRTVIATDAAALLTFVRGLRGLVHVTFAEGTQAQWLVERLRPPKKRQAGPRDRVSDRTMVASARPPRFRNGTELWSRRDTPMAKPPARPLRSDGKRSRARQASGLIVNEQTLKRSVRTKCALDNHSHRTPELSCERAAR
jgi:hypothetical protein